MFAILYSLIKSIEPFLVPLCFLSAWLLSALVLLTVFGAAKDIVERSKQMHQIPCSDCQFFTNNHRLKCTVNPHIACTEEAVGCSDYCFKE